MLLPLFDYLANYFGPFRVFEFITVRAIAATLSALLFSLILGPKFINRMRDSQVGQVVREEGPALASNIICSLAALMQKAPNLKKLIEGVINSKTLKGPK